MKLLQRAKQSKILYGGIAAVLILLVIFGFVSSRQRTPVDSWMAANSIVPQSVITAAQQNSRTALNPNQMRVLKIPNRGAGELYFIDFNSPQLCGSAGCLYVLYNQQGQSMLTLLLDTRLPRNTAVDQSGRLPLISVSEQIQNGFACFDVAQVADDDALSNSRYCYQGAGFAVVNSSIIGQR